MRLKPESQVIRKVILKSFLFPTSYILSAYSIFAPLHQQSHQGYQRMNVVLHTSKLLSILLLQLKVSTCISLFFSLHRHNDIYLFCTDIILSPIPKKKNRKSYLHHIQDRDICIVISVLDLLAPYFNLICFYTLLHPFYPIYIPMINLIALKNQYATTKVTYTQRLFSNQVMQK